MLKVFFLILFTTTAYGQNFHLETKILLPNQIKKIIGSLLPKKGSLEELNDYKQMLKYQALRTEEDCKQASSDRDTSLKGMFGGKQKILTDAEIKKMKSFLFKVYVSAGINIFIAKNLFRRPRPYIANPEIIPCIGLEKSYAFPSGHTLLMRVYASVLSRVYPERESLLMDRADQYALSRVIGGVHHPSDIAAAELLGNYLAQEMMESDEFTTALNAL